MDFCSLSFSNFQEKKKSKSSLWFSLLHPNFLRTGARYLPDKGILFDPSSQVCNAHSMQCCVSAENISHSFVQDWGSRVTAAFRGQHSAVFSPSPAAYFVRDKLVWWCSRSTGNPCGTVSWYILHGGRTQDFWNNSGIRGIIVQMNIFRRLKDFWFSLHQLCASCIRKAAYRPRAGEIRKPLEL